MNIPVDATGMVVNIPVAHCFFRFRRKSKPVVSCCCCCSSNASLSFVVAVVALASFGGAPTRMDVIEIKGTTWKRPSSSVRYGTCPPKKTICRVRDAHVLYCLFMCMLSQHVPVFPSVFLFALFMLALIVLRTVGVHFPII